MHGNGIGVVVSTREMKNALEARISGDKAFTASDIRIVVAGSATEAACMIHDLEERSGCLVVLDFTAINPNFVRDINGNLLPDLWVDAVSNQANRPDRLRQLFYRRIHSPPGDEESGIPFAWVHGRESASNVAKALRFIMNGAARAAVPS